MALDARRRSLTGTLLWLCILSDIVCLALPTSPEPAGLSLEVREDGVRGYWYETADHVGVGAVAFDPNGKVLYLTAYDPATGHDVVVQVDPRDRRGNGDGASTRGARAVLDASRRPHLNRMLDSVALRVSLCFQAQAPQGALRARR